jgi:hypothetical protein
MAHFGRYNLSEISLSRIYFALKARLIEIQHSFAWELQPLARINKGRINGFRGIHAGQRCFIVTNGPSLVKTNLEILRNEVTFGMNRIYLLFGRTSFRPTYYLAVNELVLEQFSGEIRQLEMPKFLNWNRRSLFDVDDERTIFLKSRMVIRDSFQYDLTRPLVMGGTVTFVALQLAYYMGFQKVILVGLDHSYAGKGIPSGTETRTAERDESHFHPDYFPKGAKWQLPDLLRSEIDYRIARGVYERDGREIADATIGGKCEVFKKVDYLSLFD